MEGWKQHRRSPDRSRRLPERGTAPSLGRRAGVVFGSAPASGADFSRASPGGVARLDPGSFERTRAIYGFSVSKAGLRPYWLQTEDPATFPSPGGSGGRVAVK